MEVASASRAGKNRSLRMSKLFVAEVASAGRTGYPRLLFSCDADVLEFDVGFGTSYIYAQFELGASLVE